MSKLIPRSAAVTWTVVATLLVGGCGSGERTQPRESATATPRRQVSVTPTPTEPMATAPEPTIELLREWVAVFRVADARDLQQETDEFLRLVPKNIAIAPIGCWVGLPERLGNPKGESVYVAAVVAESRQELDRVVEKIGRDPILLGEFPAMCVD